MLFAIFRFHLSRYIILKFSNASPIVFSFSGKHFGYLEYSNFRKHYTGFRMHTMPKLINPPDPFHLITSLPQVLHIPGQCRRITADVHHPFRCHLHYRIQASLIAALPWRIDDDNIRTYPVLLILLRRRKAWL